MSIWIISKYGKDPKWHKVISKRATRGMPRVKTKCNKIFSLNLFEWRYSKPKDNCCKICSKKKLKEGIPYTH